MINEGIIKINSKMLESSDLKRLDKQEKENITTTAATVKGRTFFICTPLLVYWLKNYLLLKEIKSNVNKIMLGDKQCCIFYFHKMSLMKCEKEYHLQWVNKTSIWFIWKLYWCKKTSLILELQIMIVDISSFNGL